ncbi:methyltransferase domain-containing protein [Dechloromonas denitrificans]|nr:class I SAM-dependent methyltransferase [Dechloromonas denitrificans]
MNMEAFPGEEVYLWLFDDVAKQLEEGQIKSGREHFEKTGNKEIRDGVRQLATRKMLAYRWLRGSGIEIGALHNPLHVFSSTTQVRYVDRLNEANLRCHYPELNALDLVPVSIIDDGETLSSLPDNSQDFVIANHVIEHTEDPIRALNTWFRVLRPGGTLYLGVPDKRFTFDQNRVNTPWIHLVADHTCGPEGSRKQHYEEWIRYIGKHTEYAEVEILVQQLMAQNYSIHFHVWDAENFTDFLNNYRESYNPGFGLNEFQQNLASQEMIYILKKDE